MKNIIFFAKVLALAALATWMITTDINSELKFTQVEREGLYQQAADRVSPK